MSQELANRSESRKFLAQLIGNQSKMPEKVFPYRTEDFEGISPVVLVTSAGTGRTRFSLKGGSAATFYLGVETFVLYADPDADPPWTNEDAEDMMDNLEQEIAQILSNNVKAGPWKSINYEERSIVTRVTVGGSSYLYEILPIMVEVF